MEYNTRYFGLIWLLLFGLCSFSFAADNLAFSLTDQDGRRYSLDDSRGKVVLLFFGYTSCPDVCPMTLSRITRALKTLDSKAQLVDTVFISVDPERDNPERLRNYVAYFHPGIKALSGTTPELTRVAQLYHAGVSFNRQKPGAENYSVDHSAAIYLHDKNGELKQIIPYGLPVEHIVSSVLSHLNEVR